MPTEQGRAYGCVFCMTGKEQQVAEQIQRACSDVKATAVLQEKHKSVCGQKSKVKAVMLPGYVFFDAPNDSAITLRFPQINVIRILNGADNDWRLSGEDSEFAERVFSYHGCLDFSLARSEGERIRIISGPLKDMEGMISRIDRRGRSGQVTLKFDNREVKIWLGFDLLDALPDKNGRVHSEEKPK